MQKNANMNCWKRKKVSLYLLCSPI